MCASTVSFEFKGNLGEWGPGQDRVFQRVVLPGGSCAKARGWGSLCLHHGQRLRPISAGFQGLIRKGGVQKGPLCIPQHLLTPLFACLSVFWSNAGLGPSVLLTECVKASKSRCSQAKTGCILSEPTKDAHITRRWRELGGPQETHPGHHGIKME